MKRLTHYTGFLARTALMLLLALTFSTVTAWAAQPRGALDECVGGLNYIHVTGWAYDPVVPSKSIEVKVYVYDDADCTALTTSVRVLTANMPRADVNTAYGISGNHGFEVYIPIRLYDGYDNTFYVKAFATNASGDDNSQIGSTTLTYVTGGTSYGTDYTLYTAFTPIDGTAGYDDSYSYEHLVDGVIPVYPNSVDGSFRTNNNTLEAYVEFYSVVPIIPKGCIIDLLQEGRYYPDSWSLKAKVNAADEWTRIAYHDWSTQTGTTEFSYSCDISGNPPVNDNAYRYFRFEATRTNRGSIELAELRLYGYTQWTYTPLTAKAATCTETGIKRDCYRRDDGKYFIDNFGFTELAESDVIAPMIPHNVTHYAQTSSTIEYWQCSVCGKLFSDAECTNEIDRILETCEGGACRIHVKGWMFEPSASSQSRKVRIEIYSDEACTNLYGEIHLLKSDVLRDDVNTAYGITGGHGFDTNFFISDAGTYYVKAYAQERDNSYVQMNSPYAMVTVTAPMTLPGNYTDYTAQDLDVLTGTTGGTLTIADGASIALFDATITGGIVCAGTATIILAGTNSVTGADYKAGIQVGGAGTTLTIKGDGSLTATGGDRSAGIGLSDAGNDTGGDIVIEGGNITAIGGRRYADSEIREMWGAGIGTAVSPPYRTLGNITIKGGTVSATGYSGIGKGYLIYADASITIGTVKIYDTIDKVDAFGISGLANAISEAVTYMHGETDVTESAGDYFRITTNGTRRYIQSKGMEVPAEVSLWITGDESYMVQDGDIVSGSTSGTLTIVDGASITLRDATITGGIVCSGTATITLEGTNSVTGATYKAGIQVGPSGTTLTIKGDGSLTATGSYQAAGIGLSRSGSGDVTGGDIVVEGGNITANGGYMAAGIGTGTMYTASVNGGHPASYTLGSISIKGGTVTATGGTDANGIGAGYTYSGATYEIGSIKIYYTVTKVDASGISEPFSYMIGENDVTTNAADYFNIVADGSRRVITPLPGVTLSGNYTAQDGDTVTGSTSGTVTIADGATITLFDATITGGIVCAGTATIILAGTNRVTSADYKAGIQVGGAGTTLIIKGDGSLTATGGVQSAGIGLGRAWETNATGGDIVIEGGNITAKGGYNPWGAGIGTGVAYNATATLGDIIIKGGNITSSSDDGAGIGTGFCYPNSSNKVGAVKIYGGNITSSSVDGAGIGAGYCYDNYDACNVDKVMIYNTIDKVDASSFSKAVTYMHGETDVTAFVTRFFNIEADGNRRVITPLPFETLSGNYTAQDGDILTGSTSGTVTIADGATITIINTTITGGIVCAGTATIIFAGTNIVTGAENKAGIQIGGAGTTLTIKGNGSLTATGSYGSAGIGLSYAESDVTGGDIVIEGGTVTATGYNGIGKGFANEDVFCSIGMLTIYDTIEMVDVSSISEIITYMHGETDVTANMADYFTAYNDGDRYKIVRKECSCVITDGVAYDYNQSHDLDVYYAIYTKTLDSERIGKYQAWMVPFDYTITDADTEKFTFYKINMIANAPAPGEGSASDEMWVFLTRLNAGVELHGNMPYVYKPLEAVNDYIFSIKNTTKRAKKTDAIAKTETMEDVYSFYATYENTPATASAPFYYVNIDGGISLGNDGSTTVGPFRWIIRKTSKYGDTPPSYVREMHFFDGEDDDPTSMNNEQWTMNNEESATWFDLNGRRFASKPTQKGIYIHNGKKEAIR